MYVQVCEVLDNILSRVLYGHTMGMGWNLIFSGILYFILVKLALYTTTGVW